MSVLRQPRAYNGFSSAPALSRWTTSAVSGGYVEKRIEPCACGGFIIVPDVHVVDESDVWRAVERVVMAHQRTPLHAEWSVRWLAEQAA